MLRLSKNKKGNVEDALFAVVMMVSLAITVIIGGYIFSQFLAGYNALSTIDASSKATMNTYNTSFMRAWDYGYLFLMLGFIVASVVFARFIPSSPGFYVFAFIYSIFIFLLSVLLAFVYVKFTTKNSAIAAYALNYPIINFITPNMLFYAIIYVALVSIALYAKDN